MAKYGKVLAWAGPIVLPILVAGIRSFLNKRQSPETNEDHFTPSGGLLDEVVNSGIKGLSGGRGQAKGRRK